MIDVKLAQHRGISRFEVSGNQLQVAAEIGLIISQVFAQTEAINPEAAEIFRKCIEVMMLPDSPVWSLSPIVGDGMVTAVISMRREADNVGGDGDA